MITAAEQRVTLHLHDGTIGLNGSNGTAVDSSHAIKVIKYDNHINEQDRAERIQRPGATRPSKLGGCLAFILFSARAGLVAEPSKAPLLLGGITANETQ